MRPQSPWHADNSFDCSETGYAFWVWGVLEQYCLIHLSFLPELCWHSGHSSISERLPLRRLPVFYLLPMCHQAPHSCNSVMVTISFSFPFFPSCFSRTRMGSTCTTGPCLMGTLDRGQLWWLPNCCSTTSWSSCRRLWTSWGTRLSFHPPAWERTLTIQPPTAGRWHGQPPCVVVWGPQARPAPLQHASSLRRRSHMSAWLLGP